MVDARNSFPLIGPDPMTKVERKRFFDFYKDNRSRALFGFLKDIKRSEVNDSMLSECFGGKERIECLVAGCSHWANPKDLLGFVKSYNPSARVRVVAIDVLPDALLEGVQREVEFLPLLAPAQEMPFLDNYFDVIVADGLLNCCCFEQHEPIVRELHRVAKEGAIILLGLANSNKNTVVKPAERPIAIYCRPLKDFKEMFKRHGFCFPEGSSIGTRLAQGSEIGIDNCIARK